MYEIFDIDEFTEYLERMYEHYAQAAPDVSDWAWDLKFRCKEERRSVTLDEIMTADWIGCERRWLEPDRASREVIKCRLRHGQKVPGHDGEADPE